MTERTLTSNENAHALAKQIYLGLDPRYPDRWYDHIVSVLTPTGNETRAFTKASCRIVEKFNDGDLALTIKVAPDFRAERGTELEIRHAQKATEPHRAPDPRHCPQCGPHPTQSSAEHARAAHTVAGVLGVSPLCQFGGDHGWCTLEPAHAGLHDIQPAGRLRLAVADINREVAAELVKHIVTASEANEALVLGPQSVHNLRWVLNDVLSAAGAPPA